MRRSGKISVALSSHEQSQVRAVVEAGEFASSAAVLREALRAWLRRRALHAGRHGAESLGRSFAEGHDLPIAETAERVELMFDAGDAKA
jgi:Arc/MetJ-type ribon-helix-helix transcriptional regulator